MGVITEAPCEGAVIMDDRVNAAWASTPTVIALAYHEAGHAVMAFLDRIALKGATIIPNDLYKGCVEHANLLHGEDIAIETPTRSRWRMERLVRVFLAGPVAQQRIMPWIQKPSVPIARFKRGVSCASANFSPLNLPHWAKRKRRLAKNWASAGQP